MEQQATFLAKNNIGRSLASRLQTSALSYILAPDQWAKRRPSQTEDELYRSILDTILKTAPSYIIPNRLRQYVAVEYMKWNRGKFTASDRVKSPTLAPTQMEQLMGRGLFEARCKRNRLISGLLPKTHL